MIVTQKAQVTPLPRNLERCIGIRDMVRHVLSNMVVACESAQGGESKKNTGLTRLWGRRGLGRILRPFNSQKDPVADSRQRQADQGVKS